MSPVDNQEAGSLFFLLIAKLASSRLASFPLRIPGNITFSNYLSISV